MIRVLTTLVVLALALPAVAVAQQTNAPPGNSAIDEYLETVPGSSGNARPRPATPAGDGVLSAAERARLEQLGPDGKALADAVDSTAPKPASGKPEILGEVDGRSPFGEVLRSVGEGDGGMGLLLPAILLAALLAAIVAVVLRRREAS